MNFDDLFADLEQRFDAMLQAAGNQTQTRAIELQLCAGSPKDLGGGAGRILMISPHFGIDFVAGIDALAGTWVVLRLELIRSVRFLSDAELVRTVPTADALLFETASELTSTDSMFADVVADWLVPIRLGLLLRGGQRFIESRLVSVSNRFVALNQDGFRIQVPVANLLGARANLADFAACG